MAMTIHELASRTNGHAGARSGPPMGLTTRSFSPRLEFEGLQPSLFADLGSHELKSQWFNVDHTVCFLVSANNHVLEMNAAAEHCLLNQRLVSIRRGALTLECERSNAVLARAVAQTCNGQSSYRREFVRGADLDWRPVEVLGLKGQPVAFVSFRQTSSLTEGLKGLAEAFGLTPMETEVLGALVRGDAPKEIGRHLNICTATVRTHLRSIFSKTNVQGISGTLRLVVKLL